MEKLLAWGRGFACLLILSSLVACNSDDSSSATGNPTASADTDSSVTAPPSSTPNSGGKSSTGNVSPHISGAPREEVLVGQAYSFTPIASDANGDNLTFSIVGKPGWTSFNTATGRLSGTPTAADVGSHEDIEISVNDGKTTTKLATFAINVVEQSNGSVTLAWQPPTENTDGTPLTNLKGFKIYYGTESGDYTQTINVTNPSLSRYVVDNLAPGTYYFAISALSGNGMESEFSGEASKTI